MGNAKFFKKEISDKNNGALESETWEAARKVMKTEIVHFANMPETLDFEAVKVSKNDGAYGIMWGRLVRDYLWKAYSGEAAEAEVVSEGVTYKVLNRGEVTAFYDADGNTLFDVENKRLEKEYGRLVKEEPPADPENESADSLCPNVGEAAETDGDKESVVGDAPEDKADDKASDVPAKAADTEEKTSAKQAAKEKLEKELKGDKDKNFAEPVIGYLLGRCAEDEGLSQDVVQEHKTWKKCVGYIYDQANNQAVGNKAAVRDSEVYEWAEDYYHKDDKAEEAEKARKEAKRKEKQKKAAADRASKEKKNPAKATPASEKKEDKPKEQTKPKKNNKDMEGQLDMFSMMGM